MPPRWVPWLLGLLLVLQAGCFDWGRDVYFVDGGFGPPPGSDAGANPADSGVPMICGCENWTVRDETFDPGTPSFATDVEPIIAARCAILGGACHAGGGIVDLAPGLAYGNIVGMMAIQAPLNRVEPGSPTDSYLMRKLLGTHEAVGGFGCRMPRQGDCLSGEILQTFWVWIEQGAMNN